MDALERLSKIQTITFDKTGTLTYGKPKVIGCESLDSFVSAEDVLRLCANAEQRSEHPLGKAIVQNYLDNGGTLDSSVQTEILAGQGLSAVVENRKILVGKPDLFHNGEANADKAAEKWYSKGATVIYVSTDERLIGLVALADTVREGAKNSITRLHSIGITPALLTGDNKAAASAIAGSVGITEVHSNLLEEDKMSLIKNTTNPKQQGLYDWRWCQ